MKQLPAHERPRERLLQQGARNLSSCELLAILIRCGNRSKSALALAQDLLAHSNGRIAPLFNLSPAQTMSQVGIGPAVFCQISAALELARRQLQEQLMTPGPPLCSRDQTKAFLSACLRAYSHEVFACLFIDIRQRIIHYQELFHGSIGETTVYPREIIKQALTQNASGIILAHNHPSGCPDPSQADIALTLELKKLLGPIQIKLIDHMIVGDTNVHSMAEHGTLSFCDINEQEQPMAR